MMDFVKEWSGHNELIDICDGETGEFYLEKVFYSDVLIWLKKHPSAQVVGWLKDSPTHPDYNDTVYVVENMAQEDLEGWSPVVV